MRYERKYRIEGMDPMSVRAVVDGLPVSFRTLFPDRQVNNIYLDTGDLRYFQENLAGVGQRRKYRIRWYGPDLEEIRQPVLEVKIKEGELGEKVTAPLPDFRMGTFPDLRRVLRGNLLALATSPMGTEAVPVRQPEAGAVARRPFPMHELGPVLLNTYRRSYLISNDRRFRLTIDWEMHYYSLGPRFRPSRNFRTDPAVVIEVKYALADDDHYHTVGQYLPFRLGKNSKYVNGMLIAGGV